jgi:hypothetical protein
MASIMRASWSNVWAIRPLSERKLVAAVILSLLRTRLARSLSSDWQSSGCFSAKALNAARLRKLNCLNPLPRKVPLELNYDR